MQVIMVVRFAEVAMVIPILVYASNYGCEVCRSSNGNSDIVCPLVYASNYGCDVC